MSTTPTVFAQANSIRGTFPAVCGVYAITHIPTGKRYVGQSIDCIRRWCDHCAVRGKDSQIGAAISAFGREQFIFEILAVCPPEELVRTEAVWIKRLNALHPHGFNLKPYLLKHARIAALKAARHKKDIFG